MYAMPYEFFTISVHDDGRAAAELNAFMRTHRVLAVKRRWVDLGANSFWSFCIDYWQGAERSEDAVRGVSRNRVDYRESLSPDDFAVFARLRDCEPAPIFGNCHNSDYRFKNRPARRLSTKPRSHSISWNPTTPTKAFPKACPTIEEYGAGNCRKLSSV